MHKGLIAGAAVFSMFSAYSLQAATVERVSPSNKPQLQNLLLTNQSLQKNQTKGSYFEEVILPHHNSNGVLRKNSSNKILQQYYSGVPIWGQQVRIQDKSQHMSGFFATDIDDAKLQLRANSQFDLEAAVLAVLKASKLSLDSSYKLLKSERYIYVKNDQAHYAYLIELEILNAEHESKPSAIINEKTYEVFKAWNNIKHTQAMGPGGNEKVGRYEYGEDYPAFAVSQVGETCFLENDKVKTVSMESGSEPSSAFSFPCDRNTHKEVNGAYSPLNDAHAFGTSVFDMYEQWYNTAPLTFKLLLRVHQGDGWENATWNGSAMSFGDGADSFYPLVSLDIVSHEVSHGVTEQNSNLFYYDQSGGINESFSDMAGETAEYFVRGSTDWLTGADITKNRAALRYFETPSNDGISIDHASEFYSGIDVHYSSGVFNRAFYLLANKPEWDPRKAFQIMLYANQNYWVNSTDFIDGACGAINSAIDLGYKTNDVVDAFNTVGVVCNNIQFIDNDNDGMDDNWELLYSLDSSDPTDAAGDLDDDGLTNLEEYRLNSLPNNSDTDGDSLTDYQEHHEYQTSLTNPDSDNDKMTDGWEVNFALDPLDSADAESDLDNDSFTNLIEFLLGSDPSDADSTPSIPETIAINFNDNLVPESFDFTDPSMPWETYQIDESYNFSLTNNDIDDNQTTSFEYSFVTDQTKYLSFVYKLSTEADFDHLYVYLNEQLVVIDSGITDWRSFEQVIPTGLNTLKFAYIKDSSVSSGLDSVFIDNIFISNEFADTDGDSIPDSWEVANGLDPSNPDDASLDNDNDGLSNLNEFLNQGDPNNLDTDGDQIPDGWEYEHGLNLTDSTDAMLDSDNDGFSNYTEFQLQTDPQDADSFPEQLNLTSSFEDSQLPQWFNHSSENNADWYIDNSFATDGSQSIRSGKISDSQMSSFSATGVFVEAYLIFDYKIESEECCDSFVLKINGSNSDNKSIAGTKEGSVTVKIPEGVNVIEFSYTKDGSISTEEDAVWLDNFKFIPNTSDVDTDSDGLPDFWEVENGLNLTDANDASSDYDNDELTALQEYALGTDPRHSDSDGDELPDGYEVNVLMTSPINVNATGSDRDEDGFTDVQEYYAQSSPTEYASTPSAINNLFESFETGGLPNRFTVLAANNVDWISSDSWSSNGVNSLSFNPNFSGETYTQVNAGFAIAGLFEQGFITVDYNINKYRLLQVQVNNEDIEIQYEKSRLLIPIASGFNTIKFNLDGADFYRYDSFFIDRVVWTSEVDTSLDTDSDGMADFWEYQFGLNVLDSFDASQDLDRDGLANLTEFEIGSNPTVEDTDSDGVVDSEDSHPDDPNLGENLPPVFSDLSPVTIEGIYENTYISRSLYPEVTDNNRVAVDVYPSSRTLVYGENQITWVAEDIAGNSARAVQTFFVTDTTPPIIQDYAVAMNGGFTEEQLFEELLSRSVVYDAVSGINEITIESDIDIAFESGRYSLDITASDNAGNTTAGTINLHINPRIDIQPYTYVYRDALPVVALNVRGKPLYDNFGLNLIAGNYIQSISDYSYEGTKNVVLGNMLDSLVDSIELEVYDGGYTEEFNKSEIIHLDEDAPRSITATYKQNGKRMASLVKGYGTHVEIQAYGFSNYEDLELKMTLLSDDQVINEVYVYTYDSIIWRGDFNFADDWQGEITFNYDILKDGESVMTKTETVSLIDNVTFDNGTADTDGDNIPDSTEWIGDSDGDGIVDFLDSSSNTSKGVLASGAYVFTNNDYHVISAGDVIRTQSDNFIENMNISEEMLLDAFTDMDVEDPHFQLKSDLININVELAQRTESVDLALPILENSLLSDELQARVLTLSGWKSVEIIASSDFSSECSNCSAFTVVDGSEFDLDGEKNGFVEVVAKLAQESLNSAPTLSLIIPETIDELHTFVLDASGTSDSDADELTYNWSVSIPEVTIENQNESIAILKVSELLESKQGTISLTINDGYEEFVHEQSVLFLHVNQLPTIELANSYTVNENVEGVITVSATDKESQPLTYNWIQTQGLQADILQSNSQTLKFKSPTVSEDSLLKFKVAVSDGEGTAEQSIDVTVKNVTTSSNGDKAESSSGGVFVFLIALLPFVYRRRVNRH
ncbi:M4 family metallopeptidase [Pseudoalteromonas sp. P1-8]|uniref:M4 family metallopeptidase n=1 Tax=Pseudoalteromonas sp. P1-8 TaxID=1710353 RepID=UPI0006DD17DB|nr:M4 family metallopeptidase [Pseudoalteromonas sp. P1-8]KPW04550.1 Hemagglutinin/proteinase precursor [Pseudoalteromonas sp. P1-8]